jgi:hypothetical protein
VEGKLMRVVLDALHELRAAEFLQTQNKACEPINEVAGLLSGTMLGSALWILLLRLTWFS